LALAPWPASSAGAVAGGTFKCGQNAYPGKKATVVVDQFMAAGTSGSTGISYATPGNTTLTYCTLTGTVPVGWTVSLYGGTDLYLANR
jgi:hypothetical protein